MNAQQKLFERGAKVQSRNFVVSMAILALMVLVVVMGVAIDRKEGDISRLEQQNYVLETERDDIQADFDQAIALEKKNKKVEAKKRKERIARYIYADRALRRLWSSTDLEAAVRNGSLAEFAKAAYATRGHTRQLMPPWLKDGTSIAEGSVRYLIDRWRPSSGPEQGFLLTQVIRMERREDSSSLS